MKIEIDTDELAEFYDNEWREDIAFGDDVKAFLTAFCKKKIACGGDADEKREEEIARIDTTPANTGRQEMVDRKEKLLLRLTTDIRKKNLELSAIQSKIEVLEYRAKELQDQIISNNTKVPENLDVPVKDLGLNARACNCLLRAGLITIRDVIERYNIDQLCTIRNLGAKTREEIEKKFAEYGCPLDI